MVYTAIQVLVEPQVKQGKTNNDDSSAHCDGNVLIGLPVLQEGVAYGSCFVEACVKLSNFDCWYWIAACDAFIQRIRDHLEQVKEADRVNRP